MNSELLLNFEVINNFYGGIYMAKKFGAGLVPGVLPTVGALPSVFATFSQKVLAPDQKEATTPDHNRL